MIPLGLIIVIVIADVFTDKSSQLGPLLIVAPAVTASFAGPRLTGLMGALAVAGQILSALAEGTGITAGLQIQVVGLAVVSGFLVALRAVRDLRERQLAQTRSIAAAAQEVLIRPLPKRCGSLRIATDYIAAELEARVGGDLYAAARADRATRVIIGDVRGKGLLVIKDTSLLLGAFHGSAYRNLSLPHMAIHLGNAMYWSWAGAADDDPEAGESFVTVLLLDFPDHVGHVETISCGHPPPLLMHDGEVSALDARSPGLPLGITVPSEDQYVVDTFPFEVGDVLLLYTDGVIESASPNGTFYPLTKRMAAWGGTGGPEHLVRFVHEDLLRHAQGPLGDDAALIAIQRLPERAE
ncbi:PP2C family protein-serine/threonine phosphatase [Streptomyces chiangmaiensis]|uniref:PP2C family protein-serine/threonine phosphatase n=1 Tax=Streptomyces chiangmaiensis TaxID=766497 RepID=A0ABU7FTD6_9ACTN|nr:PP2C family protein-serine/threonine phosphatase [Streptomyces chiangmaiensis]MED7826743.1 PP2C family protein-serine/threonine phosphatase [Streptomyces chiangmaiensis]